MLGVHALKLSLSFDFQTYHFDFECDAEKCDRNIPKKRERMQTSEKSVKENEKRQKKNTCAQLRIEYNRNTCKRMIQIYAHDDNLIKHELLRCTICARSHLLGDHLKFDHKYRKTSGECVWKRERERNRNASAKYTRSQYCLIHIPRLVLPKEK